MHLLIYNSGEEGRSRIPNLLFEYFELLFACRKHDNAALAWKTSYILMSLESGGSEREVSV